MIIDDFSKDGKETGFHFKFLKLEIIVLV